MVAVAGTLVIAGRAEAWQIGHRTVVWEDPDRGNRSIQTEVYYPSDVAGEGVPVGGDGTERFPVVVFGHGFLMTVTAYEYLWEGLTPAGYILALPRTEGGLLPDHAAFGADLAFLADTLRGEGARPASFLYERVASTAAVSGHSMGGGASILAASGSSTITAVANLAAANTNPSAIVAAPGVTAPAPGVTAPALMFSGSADCVTPPAQHQIPIYDALGSDCRTRITLDGASHCQFAESNFNCSLGEGGCPSPTLTRAQQHALTLLLLQPWLDAWLKEDAAAWSLFQERLNGQGGISFVQDCEVAGVRTPPGVEFPSGDRPATAARLTLSPNPLRPGGSAPVRIVLDSTWPAPRELVVRSVDGRVVRRLPGLDRSPRPGGAWDWDGLDERGRRVPSGVYICESRANGRSVRGTLVVLR